MSDLRRAWASFRSRPAGEQRQLIRRALRRLRNEGLSTTLDWARAGGTPAREPDRYLQWCRIHTPDLPALAAMRGASDRFAVRPLVSILTATYNTDPHWLEAAGDSVMAQAYPHWEWSIGDDGSTNADTIDALDRQARRDPRIVVTRAERNGGVSAASNLALAHARGEFVALMDHDDALLPHALFRIVERLNGNGPQPDVVYSDEDKLDLSGRRCDPYFKPDWSPDLFRSSMYACHLLVIRRSIVQEVGGFRSEFDFSQDYDLMLRVMERTGRIDHVPDVLYHWRKTPASTALSGDAKPSAHGAGARALQAHLNRQGIPGRVLDAGPHGLYRIKYDIVGRPRVSIVIPVRDVHSGTVARTLAALESATAYRPFDVVLVTGEGQVKPVSPPGLEIRTIAAAAPYNVSTWINLGARAAQGDHILVMQDDLEPLDPEWLESMLELSAQPWVGAVGAKLYDARGSLHHMGLIVGLNGLAGRPFEGHAAGTVGYYSGANCIRNYSAVSLACLMTRKAVFEQVGGVDEDLPVQASEVDYGLRVGAAGLRVVYTPYARLRQHGADGREERPVSADELARLRARWGSRLDVDPAYNPNLSLAFSDYRIA